MAIKVKVLVTQSCLTMTEWAVAHQVPLSMGFSRQEYWSVLPFPSPGIFPTQGWNSGLLHYRQILYYLSHLREAPLPGDIAILRLNLQTGALISFNFARAWKTSPLGKMMSYA